jgi:hypothetical protein
MLFLCWANFLETFSHKYKHLIWPRWWLWPVNDCPSTTVILKEFCLLGYKDFESLKPRFGGTYLPHLQGLLVNYFMLVPCMAYSSALNREANCTSEMSVDFQRTTRCYVPEDRTPPNNFWYNLKFYTIFKIQHAPFSSVLQICFETGVKTGTSISQR